MVIVLPMPLICHSDLSFPVHCHITIPVLLQLLQDETNQNADMYVTLIGDADQKGLASIMRNHVYSKHFKNEYVDLLPFVMSNALQLEIIVIEYHDSRVFKTLHHFQPRTSREKRYLP